MVEITTYHGTTQAFDKPDTSYLRVGEGASSYGAGFYVATHPEMVYDHLRERNNGAPVTNENFNGVIYEIDLDIPDERVVSRQDTFNQDDLNRFIDSADNIGDSDLANDLRDLQELMVNDGSYKYDTSIRTNINRDTGSISVSEGRVSFDHLETFLDDTVGQEGTARVISNAGYDAIYSGNPGPQYEMYTVLNLDAIKGETRVFETFGDGPLTKVAEVAEPSGRLGRVLDSATTGLKVVGKALPIVGGVVAGAEVLGLSSEAHAALANGDITTTEFAALEGIYGAHIAQGTVDPTGFGGEIAIQKAYGELSEGWSPELQELLRPSSLGDLFEKSEKSAEQTQFEQVIEGLEGADINLSPEAQKLSDLYNDVVEAEQNYDAAIQQKGTLGGSQIQETMQAEAQMEEAYEAYEEHYNGLEESGKLDAITAELEGDFTGPDADQAGNPDQLRQAQAHGLENNVAANTAEVNTVSTPSYAQDFAP